MQKHMDTSLWARRVGSLLFLLTAGLAQAAGLNLIPLPASVESLPGNFAWNTNTVVVADGPFTNETAWLAGELGLKPAADVTGNEIRLTTQGSAGLGEEAYMLEVNPQGVTIHASAAAGAFYGGETLRQLIQPDGRIPCVKISDAPHYAWRGLMLDVSRHFFDAATVRQMLDWMADYKLNRLHLHLTDDEAWRMAIAGYPELTQVGARGNHSDRAAPARFFTREEMAGLIRYAAQRHIVIVPEIDLPGHAGAAVRTYPQLDGGTNTFNPARPETYEFLQNVLAATMAIFPSPWIHIGGDEVNLSTWDRSPEVAKVLRTDGLKNTQQLEDQFVNRMAGFIQSHGRVPAGWDEIAAGAPAPGTVIFWWRHNKPEALVQALAAGYPVVLAPRAPCYFDYPENSAFPRAGWKLVNTTRMVYDGPVIPARIPAPERRNILGIEGCLWTERIATVPYLEFMTFPRLAALAEAAWTPDDRRDYQEFSERLKPFLAEYRRLGIHYYDEGDPTGSLREASEAAVSGPATNFWLSATQPDAPQPETGPAAQH